MQEHHPKRLIYLYNIRLASHEVELIFLDGQSTDIDANGRYRPRADDFVLFMDDFVRLARKSYTEPHPYTYTDSEA